MKMKYFFPTLIALVSLVEAKAQNLDGYKNLEVLAGVNLQYFTPNISFSYDKERLTKLTYGIGLISQYYSKSIYTESTNVSSKLIVAGGLYLKYRFADSKNFTADAQLGAYIGAMANDYIYFPNLKIKQSFYIAPKLKFVIAEGLIYYFQKDKGMSKYDPQLHIGFCFNL